MICRVFHATLPALREGVEPKRGEGGAVGFHAKSQSRQGVLRGRATESTDGTENWGMVLNNSLGPFPLVVRAVELATEDTEITVLSRSMTDPRG